MIVYVTTAEHAYTLRPLLEYQRTALHGGLITMAYAEFTGWAKLPRATYILTDLDRLTDDQREQVARRCDALDRTDGCRYLNDPRRVLDRWALLQSLYRQGINPQRVARADQPLTALRFPVFVRAQEGHEGSLTGLIHSPDALDAQLQRLLERGPRGADALWIVEFYDVRNAQGLYEKYSVFRIGDHYWAHELSLSRQWLCKGEDDSEDSPEAVAAQARFLVQNPHVDRLRRVFEMAGIEYGRIDYAFYGDRLIVFEINTNPMIYTTDRLHPMWHEDIIRVNKAYIRAMAALGLQREAPYYLAVADATGDDRVVADNLFRRVNRRILKSARALEYEHTILRFRNKFKRRPASHWVAKTRIP